MWALACRTMPFYFFFFFTNSLHVVTSST
jgi:hypothetical protein